MYYPDSINPETCLLASSSKNYCTITSVTPWFFSEIKLLKKYIIDKRIVGDMLW